MIYLGYTQQCQSLDPSSMVLEECGCSLVPVLKSIHRPSFASRSPNKASKCFPRESGGRCCNHGLGVPGGSPRHLLHNAPPAHPLTRLRYLPSLLGPSSPASPKSGGPPLLSRLLSSPIWRSAMHWAGALVTRSLSLSLFPWTLLSSLLLLFVWSPFRARFLELSIRFLYSVEAFDSRLPYVRH